MRGVAETDVVITGLDCILYNNIFLEIRDLKLLLHCLVVFAISLKMAVYSPKHVAVYIL